MTRARRAHEAARWAAVNPQIAHEIEELVPRRLVGLERRARAEDAFTRDHDDALRRDVRREPALEELVHLVLEPERARRCDPPDEVRRITVPRRRAREPCISEVDGYLDRRMVARREGVHAPGDRHLTALHDHERRRSGGQVEPGELLGPTSRAAVEERELGALHVDDDATLDAETTERGEEVLDGGHMNLLGQSDRGGSHARDHGELFARRLRAAAPHDDRTAVRTCETHDRALPAVEPQSFEGDRRRHARTLLPRRARPPEKEVANDPDSASNTRKIPKEALLRRVVPALALALALAACEEKKPPAPAPTPSASVTPATTASAAPSASAAPAASASAGEGDKHGSHQANCPSAVPGATLALKDVEGGIEVSITGKDEAATKDIKARLAKLLEADKNEGAAPAKHDHSGSGGGRFGHCTIVMKNTTLTTADIPNGVKITVKAKDKAEVDWVRRETRDRDKASKAPGGGETGSHRMAHCPSAVEGAKTLVKDAKEGVVITVTGSGDGVKEIRERAKHTADVSKMTDPPKPEHNSEGKGGGGLGHCPVVVEGDTTVDVKDVEGGSEITVKAKKAENVAALQKEAKARAATFASK